MNSTFTQHQLFVVHGPGTIAHTVWDAACEKMQSGLLAFFSSLKKYACMTKFNRNRSTKFYTHFST